MTGRQGGNFTDTSQRGSLCTELMLNVDKFTAHNGYTLNRAGGLEREEKDETSVCFRKKVLPERTSRDANIPPPTLF